MNILQTPSAFLQLLLLIGKFVACFIESLYRKIVPPPMKSIDGETILVTGAVGGIGKEICKQLSRSGKDLKLVLWDLNQAALDKFKEELLQREDTCEGLKVYAFAVDISTRENIDKAAEMVKSTVGPISIIVNNAGIAPVSNFLRYSNEDIEKTIQVNLMSNFWIIRQFLPEMVAKNHGRIVNICSVCALTPLSHASPYVASKFGMNGYTESLKFELAMLNYDGIKLSTVYPSFVQTPLVNKLEFDKSSKGILPPGCKKFMEPEAVAKKAVDGMRREYEYIYCPAIVGPAAYTVHSFPVKIRRLIQASNFKTIMYKDPEDQKKFTEAYIV